MTCATRGAGTARVLCGGRRRRDRRRSADRSAVRDADQRAGSRNRSRRRNTDDAGARRPCGGRAQHVRTAWRPPEAAVMAAREAARTRREPGRAARHARPVRRLRAAHHRQAARVRRRQPAGARDVRRRGAGREEDLEGLPFVGRSGKLLDLMMAAIGLDRTAAYIANIIPWRPPGNRTPTPQESQICLPFILRQIELANPDILVCLGGPSAQTLLGVQGRHQAHARPLVRVPYRHARDPRDRDLPSGLSVALAAGEALRLARFSGHQESAGREPEAHPGTVAHYLVRRASAGAHPMDFDPVLLARLQFAFTISFHIIFPSFTIGLAAYIATLLAMWLRTGAGALPAARAVLDQDLRGLVRHGRGVGDRAVLPVRHQLEPLLGRHRQRDRPADRLRGADRLLPRGDVPRRAAVRLEPRAALALDARRPRSSRSAPRSRRSGSSPPTAGCRRRPATRCATASPIRSTGSRSSSIRASRIASPTCSPPRT